MLRHFVKSKNQESELLIPFKHLCIDKSTKKRFPIFSPTSLNVNINKFLTYNFQNFEVTYLKLS